MSEPRHNMPERWIGHATPAERLELAEIDAARKRVEEERRSLTDRWRRLTQRIYWRERDARRRSRAA